MDCLREEEDRKSVFRRKNIVEKKKKEEDDEPWHGNRRKKWMILNYENDKHKGMENRKNSGDSVEVIMFCSVCMHWPVIMSLLPGSFYFSELAQWNRPLKLASGAFKFTRTSPVLEQEAICCLQPYFRVAIEIMAELVCCWCKLSSCFK